MEVRASARRDDRAAAEAPQLRGRRAVPSSSMLSQNLTDRRASVQKGLPFVDPGTRQNRP
jgi:hypothetical protein